MIRVREYCNTGKSRHGFCGALQHGFHYEQI